MRVAAALLPVVLFLAGLFLMDSFKLVRPRQVVTALAAGAGAALISLWLQEMISGGVSPDMAIRYLGPLTEEAAKAAPIVLLIATRRAGFLVDAAVQGFAVGAGFALMENVTYLRHLPDAAISLWLVRGIGTAILHGATGAIIAMVSKALTDRNSDRAVIMFLPGLAIAVVVHSAFNHLILTPVAQAVVLLIVLPPLLIWIFDRSERATREWIGAGLDLDLEVLQLIASQHFGVTRFGEYLQQLRARFPGVVVANMYCLLRLELELAVQAKAFVMARGAGLNLPADQDITSSLAELEYLKRSIGRTGLLAIKPLQVTSQRDRWHRNLLKGA